MNSEKTEPCSPVVRRGTVALLVRIGTGREAVEVIEGLQLFKSLGKCGRLSNPEFIRQLEAMDGKDLKKLRYTIERMGCLRASEIVTTD